MAELGNTGVNYRNASASKPSDSFPGLTAIVSGGSPRTFGAYYDVAYDRVLAPPEHTTGNNLAGGICTPGQPNGTTTEYEEGIDIDQMLLNGGAPGAGPTDGGVDSINPTRLSQCVCRRSKLWNAEGRKQPENLTLDHWAGRRRDELLRMLDQLGQSIEQLSIAVEEAGHGPEDVRRLLTHPGVGRIVALAFALTIGPVDRFPTSKQLVGGISDSIRSDFRARTDSRVLRLTSAKPRSGLCPFSICHD